MIFTEMRKAGIGVQLHYQPIHLNPYYRQMGFKEGDYPNAEQYEHSCFSLPVYPGLTESEIIYVVDTLTTIAGNIIDK